MSIRSLVVALALLLPAPLVAQGITIPNTFVNGTAADATQVNANFTALANNALNRTGGTMTGALTTLLVQPTVTNASDVGTSSLFYRTHYLRTSLVLGQAAGNYTVTWANPAAARAISFEDPGGTDILVYKAATQTLTNKTLTSPVLTTPTFSGVYTLGGTPTIPASGLTGTITSATQDLITRLGTIVSGVWNAGAITSSGGIVAGAAGFSTAGPVAANTLVLSSGLSAASAVFSSTLRADGNVSIGNANVTFGVATPTIAGGTCGTSPAIASGGKAYAFRITTGTGSYNTCGVNFNMTFANAPSCVFSQVNSADDTNVSVASTTVLTLSTTLGNFTPGNVIHVHCVGY